MFVVIKKRHLFIINLIHDIKYFMEFKNDRILQEFFTLELFCKQLFYIHRCVPKKV